MHLPEADLYLSINGGEKITLRYYPGSGSILYPGSPIWSDSVYRLSCYPTTGSTPLGTANLDKVPVWTGPATLTKDSPQILITADIENFFVGSNITGNGIPDNTTVIDLVGRLATLSKNATLDGSQTLTTTPPGVAIDVTWTVGYGQYDPLHIEFSGGGDSAVVTGPEYCICVTGEGEICRSCGTEIPGTGGFLTGAYLADGVIEDNLGTYPFPFWVHSIWDIWESSILLSGTVDNCLDTTLPPGPEQCDITRAHECQAKYFYTMYCFPQGAGSDNQIFTTLSHNEVPRSVSLTRTWFTADCRGDWCQIWPLPITPLSLLVTCRKPSDPSVISSDNPSIEFSASFQTQFCTFCFPPEDTDPVGGDVTVTFRVPPQIAVILQDPCISAPIPSDSSVRMSWHDHGDSFAWYSGNMPMYSGTTVLVVTRSKSYDIAVDTWQGALNWYANDVQLFQSLNDPSEIPTSGQSTLIVASVSGTLYFRMFYANGGLVVDTNETNLPAQALAIQQLKFLLQNLWPPHQLTQTEKDQITQYVEVIVNYFPIDAGGQYNCTDTSFDDVAVSTGGLVSVQGHQRCYKTAPGSCAGIEGFICNGQPMLPPPGNSSITFTGPDNYSKSYPGAGAVGTCFPETGTYHYKFDMARCDSLEGDFEVTDLCGGLSQYIFKFFSPTDKYVCIPFQDTQSEPPITGLHPCLVPVSKTLFGSSIVGSGRYKYDADGDQGPGWYGKRSAIANKPFSQPTTVAVTNGSPAVKFSKPRFFAPGNLIRVNGDSTGKTYAIVSGDQQDWLISPAYGGATNPAASWVIVYNTCPTRSVTLTGFLSADCGHFTETWNYDPDTNCANQDGTATASLEYKFSGINCPFNFFLGFIYDVDPGTPAYYMFNFGSEFVFTE